MKVNATFRRFASSPKMSLQYFLICVLTPLLVAGQTTEYALLGKKVTLMPDIKIQPEEILWKHNKDMVVEFNGQTEQLYGSFDGRVTLDWHSAEITIIDLSFEDSGLYELQTSAKNKLLETFQYTLEVIDRVAKPTVSCKMNNGSSSDKSGRQATLTCSSDSQQPQPSLEFDWFSNGKKQIGPKLIISLGNALDDQVYNCTVSNKVSEDSATFTAKECYSSESFSIAAIIGIVICVVALLILLIGIYVYCHKRHGARDVENQPNKTEEEGKVLLDRAPTFPSQQTLGHLAQKHNDPDPIQKGHGARDVENQSNKTEEEGKVLLDRAPMVPSQQTLGHLDQKHNDPDPIQKGPGEDNITTPHPVHEKPPRLHDQSTNEEEPVDGDELVNSVEKKEFESNPEDSEKTNDALEFRQAETPTVSGSENHETKRISGPPPVAKKSEKVKETSSKHREKADLNKPSEAVEEKPSDSSPVVSTKPNSKEEEAAKPEGDVPLLPVPKPRSSLSLNNTNVPLEDEQKQEVSSDQTGESRKDLPTPPPHDQQPPPNETNPGETLQEGDKQVPDDKTADGLSDQEKTDLPLNNPEEPQSLDISKPDNSNTDTAQESPETELAVPDDKEKDKTRHNSENNPEKGAKAEAAEENSTEKGAKAEAAEDSNVNQS